MKELQEYVHIRPPTKEAKEIMGLLYQMKGSKKKDIPPIDDADPFAKIA